MPISPGETLESISCLCVTEDRAAFIPWLLWNYDKQDYPVRELVIVDSSARPPELPQRADIRLLRCRPGTPVPVKRNRALAEARGTLITWFDDDDWQHPRKLSLLHAALAGGTLLAGNRQSWFVDLAGGRARSHRWSAGLLFNSIGVRREAAAALRFDESLRLASDTPWLRALLQEAGRSLKVLDAPLFFWLCHGDNLSNRSARHVFTHDLEAVRQAVGRPAGGETGAALEALRRRRAAGGGG